MLKVSMFLAYLRQSVHKSHPALLVHPTFHNLLIILGTYAQ